MSDELKRLFESHGISIVHENGSYKNVYEILNDISKIWKSLEEKDKQDLIKGVLND